MEGYRNIAYNALNSLCIEIFTHYGFPETDARGIADVLLTADLYGIESHGVQRMIRYHNGMKSGEVDVRASLDTVFETPVSAVVDAHKAMGQIAGRHAMAMAISKAQTTGIGLVTVRNSNHYGIAGYYAKIACDQDLIGICMTNSEAIMVPTFSRSAMLGTNPIALAMPADPVPFLFDGATTVVPRGKLEVYSKRNQPLPQGWAFDENGQETQDAALVLHNIIDKLGGGIAPLGGTGETTAGYKGYGFGMICELFTSIASGGPTSPHCVTPTLNSLSHCFWAIDYRIFGDKTRMRSDFSNLLEDIRQAPKAKNQNRIYIHGEKELESRIDKLQTGIPVNNKTRGELIQIALETGVESPVTRLDSAVIHS